ncbi:MAG: L-threonylcarbamoyladenylate synthase [Coriobacteriales bacterium]|nr:L-threonylcarbamoyladenylate synthase [Coriobacteriales bacterium]
MEDFKVNSGTNIVDALANSQAVLVSTDTVFGLCALANTRGEKKIFPFLVYKMDQVEKYGRVIKPYVYDLVKQYWPGALTIVLNASDYSIDRKLCDANKTIAMRMPADNFCFSFLNMLNSNIVCTSANVSGQVAPAKVSDIDERFLALPHQELYDCKLGVASTVVDCTGAEPKILREGAIKL